MINTKIPRILSAYWKERYKCSLKGDDKYFYYLEASEESVVGIASLTKDIWETTLDGLLYKGDVKPRPFEAKLRLGAVDKQSFAHKSPNNHTRIVKEFNIFLVIL